ncbi:hypothetical protein [Clostridium tyrobutyricum]|uniref:hypothetical protein n=1 Tax=Clostridium tyrobutyricum TaxID=1519 RepID=UPI002011B2A6|nr:hypothetical protein [Clostridium tyrobutyricum]MBR9649446.1 hypothetical protein [Clostridium tyrobutyricum]
MKAILVGNGINIQFGGKAYSSEFIMKRIKYKATLGYYGTLFDGALNGSEINQILNSFVNITNDILDNKYDNYVKDNKSLILALNNFKKRYKKINAPHELMLEDWFFVLHMFFLKNNDIFKNLTASKQGFERLILDGIYNDGKVQNIYKNIPQKIKKFFSSFDKIFTLNYDNNLEKLTGKNVYHLHGDFSVLQNSENAENVLGFIRERKNNRVLINGMEHCFCNALLNYSGYQKLKEATTNHNLLIESENFKWRYYNDENFKADLLKIKYEKPFEYEIIMTKINHPNLKIATEYYFHEFENIKDELYIIGMSPNNDNHILNCINKNTKLNKVYFYYYSDLERKLIDEMLPKKFYTPKNVNDLWKLLKCTKKKYNVNHHFPNKIDEFIYTFNILSGDTASKKDIFHNIKNIPDFEAMRLCELVKENLKKRNPENKSTDKDEFIKTATSISYIALSEGVLPSSLYMLYIIYSDRIKNV